jgi:uncharacterized membrane protein YhhN
VTTTLLLVVTGLIAIVDWVAVARSRRGLELAAKPLTMVALVVATGFADTGPAKPWLMAALLLGLLGDVFLMFSTDGGGEHGGAASADGAFLAGLGSFLLSHLAYLVAFTRHGLHGWQMLAGGLVVVGVAALAVPRVVHGARERGGSVLVGAISVYAGVLGAMTVLGFGTAAVATAVGALLFLVSDATIGWHRFVHPLLRGPLIIIVTYHLAQILIVVGLIR